MKDKVQGLRCSCFCKKCHSKNVFYRKIIECELDYSPNDHLIRNEQNGEWHTVRTLRDQARILSGQIAAQEVLFMYKICRDCEYTEDVMHGDEEE